MRFKTRDVVTGIIVIAVVITSGLIYKNLKSPKTLPTPFPSTTREDLTREFNFEIPEDVESIELVSVSGRSGRGIATRKYLPAQTGEGGTFTHAVLADLADLESGFYEGWLVMGDEFISTGKMRIAKGGYLLEFSSSTDYSDYEEVVITLETVFDNLPETHVLEGSF